MIAQQVLRRPGALLVVALPLSVDELLKDFHSSESRVQFRDLLSSASKVIEVATHQSRASNYKAAGEYVVHNADVLLVVWDGKPAHGEGGTGEVVELARNLRLPIAWVHAGNRKPGTDEPTSLGDEQGRVEFERLDQLKDLLKPR